MENEPIGIPHNNEEHLEALDVTIEKLERNFE